MAIRAENIRSAITNHDYALRLLFPTLDRLCFAQRCGWMGVGQGKRARLHRAQRVLEELLYVRCLYISKNRNHAVLGDEIMVAKGEQILLGQPLNGIERAVGA